MLVRRDPDEPARRKAARPPAGVATSARCRRSERHALARRTCGLVVRSAVVGFAAAQCAAIALFLTSTRPRGGGWDAAFADVDAGGREARAAARRPAERAEAAGERWPARLPRMERHFCAFEGRLCRCTGTVALHSWTGDWAMVRHVNSSVRCSTDAFGDDPRPHLAKFCSCWPGLPWPPAVLEGLNNTFGRKLVPRIEIGAADAGCGAEDDGAWTPCAIMNTRLDASLLPDRLVPRLLPGEQQDVTLRKLDICHRIAGPDRALRVLGVWPSGAALAPAPVKAASAPLCAVVYAPGLGPTWDGRAAVFCPTDPAQCLEGDCECADADRERVDVKAGQNATACWACVAPGQTERPPEPANRSPQAAAERPPEPANRPTQAAADRRPEPVNRLTQVAPARAPGQEDASASQPAPAAGAAQPQEEAAGAFEPR